MSASPACCSPFAWPAKPRNSSLTISCACSAHCPDHCGRPSPSITAPSSPVTWHCAASRSTPSSAIPIRPGRRAASKTRSAECAGSCHAKLTSQPSPQAASRSSSLTTTTPPASALTSGLQPKSSAKCCTSSVNPPPRLRGDDQERLVPGLRVRGSRQNETHCRYPSAAISRVA